MQWRSQNLYTAPCNGVVSHGAQIGGLRVFADHTRKNKPKTNASMITALLRTVGRFTRVCPHAKTAVDADDIQTWWTTVFLITRKTQRPQFESHARIKMAQGLRSTEV